MAELTFDKFHVIKTVNEAVERLWTGPAGKNAR